MIPGRGLVLVRQIEVEKKLGSIHVLDSTADRMTCQQAEVVAVGEPTLYDEDAVPEAWYRPDPAYAFRVTGPYAYGKYVRGRHVFWRPLHPSLTPGAWVILQARTLIPTDERDRYMVRHDNVIGVLRES